MIDIDRKWDRNKRRNEADLLSELIDVADLSQSERQDIVAHATDLVRDIRVASRPGLMDVFLAEYGLSTEEGVALMCLAEALLRVPDAETIDALIEDKIAASDWSSHIGHSSSPLVNASTWGLLLTGKVLDDGEPGIAGRLRSMVKRLGEPLIRTAVGGAMREMGRQFVLGQTIKDAMKRAAKSEANGFTYSYDMLGEAAMTADDAARYAASYADAISAIASACTHNDIASNPGISVKLSALHPRYEVAKTSRVMAELVPVLMGLVRQAANAGMGLNIDAEEMDRLGLSMKVIEAVLADPSLDGWDGFGVVVQAYSRRAGDVIDGLYQMAERYDRKIMVRLVKGAYWDTEIKHAQVEGLSDFPVFTRKVASDVSYIANARRLLNRTDRIYPQFATHNAHTVSAVLEMAKSVDPTAYEFQRLHGMGEALHNIVHKAQNTRCRIYAPVGAHRDLLAYLVRRLLENGANSSFVNQIVDENVPPSEVAECPFEALNAPPALHEPKLSKGPDLFRPQRRNSIGFDLNSAIDLDRINDMRKTPEAFHVTPITAKPFQGAQTNPCFNPATGAQIGSVTFASTTDVSNAIEAARPWDVSAKARGEVLNKAADLYEEKFGEIFALLTVEAGKSLMDAMAELREAVDFLRYYAAEAQGISTRARGVVSCISPWNFPLAIFSGQISAALATGNAVLAKPAETTPAIAAWGVEKMIEAGVPREALQLLPGAGSVVGTAITSDPRVGAVAFTGSTTTAKRIRSTMAENCKPGTPLIAETGGLNAMIVDSTALPEQAIRDVVASSFQSAGQRCSALRCLYVQEDIAPHFTKMLIGAMNELEVGDPWHLSTDVGPVIDGAAQRNIQNYIAHAQSDGRVVHTVTCPTDGHFVAPTLIRVSGISDLHEEIFGPVLHIATFKSDQLDQVIADVNATGFGLTFGLHTRIDERVQKIADAVDAGNIYANRNQIGAIVGSQPFGGEGLSGTGPKAGGPTYLHRFTRNAADSASEMQAGAPIGTTLQIEISAMDLLRECLETTILPGPTGELNRLFVLPRPPILCLGPGVDVANIQKEAIDALGGQAIVVKGKLDAELLSKLTDFGGVIWWGDENSARNYALALAKRDGPIIPLIVDRPDKGHAVLERHLCVDTTAAGGNASLLSGDDGSLNAGVYPS